MHVDPSPPELDALLATCVALGSDLAIVQGAGGNISVKHQGVLWIKASGTRLSQAQQSPILVQLDEEKVRNSCLSTEDLTDARLDDPLTNQLRPSIETALHVLMPHVFVVHVHSVAAIAAGLSERGVSRFMSLGGDFERAVVPYAKPGIDLARAVVSAMSQGVDPLRPLVVLLRNHGVVVAAQTLDEASALVSWIESGLRKVAAPEPVSNSPIVDGFSPLFPPETLSSAGRRALTGGAMTPDSAVFLTGKPFSDGRADSPGRVESDGSVWLSASVGADEREIAMSLVDVACQLGDDEPVSYLTDIDVSQLTNWEAEKWRKSLKR